MSKTKIAVIGAGVAGSTAALYLGQLGLDITFFEKNESISSGPPYCHLHAGGNLYREISNEQCVSLLKQSINFARFYPFIIDYRPTVIVVPQSDKGSPVDLLPRLSLLQKEYEKLIEQDQKNAVLGKSEDYYRLYYKEDIEILLNKTAVKVPQNHDEWMVTAIKNIDLGNVKFPLVLVQEYGMNLFRFGAGVKLAIDDMPNVAFENNTMVQQIEKNKKKWRIVYQNEGSSA